MTQTKPRPANTYPVNSLVSIVGVPAMNKLRIDYISDGCVTVYGKADAEGNDHIFTISGSSPAIPYEGKIQSVSEETGEVTYEEIKARAPRGSYGKILESPAVPVGKFTIQEFSELNEIPYPYAAKWIKENCASCGFKEKEEGKRGRASELFQKIV